MDSTDFRNLLSKYCLTCLGVVHNPTEEDVVRFFQGSKKAHLVHPAGSNKNPKWLILFDKQSALQHYLQGQSYQQLKYDSSVVIIQPCYVLCDIPNEWEEFVQLLKEEEGAKFNQKFEYGNVPGYASYLGQPGADAKKGYSSARIDKDQAKKMVATNVRDDSETDSQGQLGITSGQRHDIIGQKGECRQGVPGWQQIASKRPGLGFPGQFPIFNKPRKTHETITGGGKKYVELKNDGADVKKGFSRTRIEKNWAREVAAISIRDDMKTDQQELLCGTLGQRRHIIGQKSDIPGQDKQDAFPECRQGILGMQQVASKRSGLKIPGQFSILNERWTTQETNAGWTSERRTSIHEELNANCREKQGDEQFVHHLRQDNQPDDFMFDGISHNERRIVLIGKTGSGKSATGNTILGISNGFESKLSGKSVTKYCQRQEVERFGKKLMVVDTPGLFDTSMPNEHTKEEIGKCIGITCPGPHAIILVVQINRFTEEEQKTVDLFVERFGEGIYRHLIVLFTRKDDLVRMNTSISTYVKDTEQLASILQRCQNRYIAFDNFSSSKDEDVQCLLNMIEDIIQENGGKYYTNNMFIEAEKCMKRRMAAIREEEEKKKKKELKEHTDKIEKFYEAEVNTQKMKQQKEIERLESIRQNELEIKAKLEKELQMKERYYEGTIKYLEQQNQKAEQKMREIEEQEKQTRDRKKFEEFQKMVEEYLREAAENEKQLKIKMKNEQERIIAEIEEKYNSKLEEAELRKQSRNEVEKKGFFKTARHLMSKLFHK